MNLSNHIPCVVVTDNPLLQNIVEAELPPDADLYLWREGEAPLRPPVKNGRQVFYGDPTDAAPYEALGLGGVSEGFVMVSLTDRRAEDRVVQRLHALFPNYPLLTIQQHAGMLNLGTNPEVTERGRVLSLSDAFAQLVRREIGHLQNRRRIHRLRSLVLPGEKLAILLQNDPDPDGIASALALRVLLGRNRQTTPIFTFGEITRPENRAMTELLEIEVITVQPHTLREFPRLALVDVQPGVFRRPLPAVHICIDHHPVSCADQDIPYRDIRTDYGATATILTEYLRAEGITLFQRLATALLYGIKSDTLLLNRQVHDSDLSAFLHLYPLINYNYLRRMERPEIPFEFMRVFRKAVDTAFFADAVYCLHLGPVQREDLIPQMADFCNQLQGVHWAFVSGTCRRRFVMSARNNGLVGHAGEVLKGLFGGIGSAGGHRSMAKAVVSLADFKRAYGQNGHAFIRRHIPQLILPAVKE